MGKKNNWQGSMMREYHIQHHIPPTKDKIAAQALAALAARDAARRQERSTPKPVQPKRKPMPSGMMQQYGLAALGREARRRGTTYGKLCSKLSAEEQEAIVSAYAEEQMLKRRGGRRRA